MSNKGSKSGSKAAPSKKVAKVKSNRGRKLEKVQISVRLDKPCMDVLYRLVKTEGYRITDLLERGAIYVLREEMGESPEMKALRFMIGEMPAKSQRRLVCCFTYFCLTQDFSITERHVEEMMNGILDAWEHDPRHERSLLEFYAQMRDKRSKGGGEDGDGNGDGGGSSGSPSGMASPSTVVASSPGQM
jgi:hypothetical protein